MNFGFRCGNMLDWENRVFDYLLGQVVESPVRFKWGVGDSAWGTAVQKEVMNNVGHVWSTDPLVMETWRAAIGGVHEREAWEGIYRLEVYD